MGPRVRGDPALSDAPERDLRGRLVANLHRHPRPRITMAEAFECTLHVPLREELARVFTDHFHAMAATYGYDAHKELLEEMRVEELVQRLEL